MNELDILKILNPKLTDLERDSMASDYNKNLMIEAMPASDTSVVQGQPMRDPFMPPASLMPNIPAPVAPKIAAVQAPVVPKIESKPEPVSQVETRPGFNEDMQAGAEAMRALRPSELEQNPDFLRLLKESQDKETKEKRDDAIARALISVGTGLGGHGRLNVDTSIVDAFAALIGKDKKDLVERETARKADAKDKFASQQYIYQSEKERIKDIMGVSKDIEQNRQAQQRLGLEALRTDDQLLNSKSQRELEDLAKKRQDLELDLSRLQLRDEKAKADPNSPISQTARTMYARELERLERPDVAAQLVQQNMSFREAKELLGSMNLSNLVTNFENNLMKKAQAEAKAAGDKKDSLMRFESRLDNVRKSEFNKITESYNKSMASLGNLSYLRDQKSGSGDMAILYDVIKAMDPDSVVREGEISLAKATAGKIDMLKNLPSNITKGTVLGPDQRRELTKVAQYVAQKNAAKKMIQAMPGMKSMIDQGTALGMDRDEVMLRLVPAEIKNVLDEQFEQQHVQEAAITKFMEDNNITNRKEAIGILRRAGKI